MSAPQIVARGFRGAWADLAPLALPPVAAVAVDDQLTALRAVAAHAEDEAGELLLVAGSRLDDELRDELLADGFAVVTSTGTAAPTTPRAPRPGRVWLLTSGTTGRPSRVAHTVDSLTTVRGAQPPRRWLCAFSPGAYAWWQVVTLALAHDDQGVVMLEPDQVPTWPVVARDEAVTAVSGTPTFWRAGLLRAPDALAGSSISQATLGGEPVDDAILSRVAEVLPEARVSWIYASSEAGASLAVHDGRAGFPVEWLEREDGPRVVDGELALRPRHPGEGFDGLLHTGDAAEVRDGRVHIVGRLGSDEINVGGSKISAAHVREVLLAHPDVSWAAVRGRRAPLMGTVVAAQVVPEPGAEVAEATLRRWCDARLPEHGVPRVIDIRPEIPLTESLKSDV